MYSTTVDFDLTMATNDHRGVQKNLSPATTWSVGYSGIHRPDRSDSRRPFLPPHNREGASYNMTFRTVHGPWFVGISKTVRDRAEAQRSEV